MRSENGFGWKAGAIAAALGMACGLARGEFRVVGYAASWGADIPSLPYSKLTHVNWSFAAPADDGSLTGIDGAKLGQLAKAAHAGHAKAFLAIGGGGNQDKGWQVCTASEAGRQALVKACMAAVHTYDLDGIDFDWEYPDGAQVAGYNATVKALAAALHAEGKEISAAVTKNDWPRSFPTKELYDGSGPGFDFLNIMVYDDPAPHSTVAAAQSGLDTWIKTKGLPKSKAVLGCPFYTTTGGEKAYKTIVAADPAAAWVDKDGAEGYNSIPTIKKKTEMAWAQAGGIMFWELSQDAPGDLSLLSAVHAVIASKGTTAIRLAAEPDGRAPRTRPGYGFATPAGSAVDASGRAMLPLGDASRALPRR
jgi:GH18 family chitinase